MTDLRADSMTGEQFVFDERTADPASTEEGERWLRTDLTSGDKIATLRVDVGTSVLDVPVFPVGTAEDSVVEAIRVRVGSQTGYIPAVPETNANFPALRLQHNGQVFGYHDEQGVFAFFDVAISSTNSPVNEGSDLNVDYSVVNTGFSLNNTQDIRLNIDSTEEDRDTNITLSPSSSTTGTLTWTTPSSSAGTYNASVLSDDDTASTSVTVEAGPAIPDSVVDNFEDANISEYTGDTASFSTTTTNVIEGTYALEANSPADNDRITSESGLNNYPSKGDIFSAVVRDPGIWPILLYGWGGESGYGIRLPTSSNEFNIFRFDDSKTPTTLNTVSATLSENVYYEVEIEWHDGTGAEADNTHVVNLYDIDDTSNPPFDRISKIATGTVTDSTYSANTGVGVGLRFASSSNDTLVDYYTIREQV